jgi:alkylated DNA repair dioxygenase AlkB
VKGAVLRGFATAETPLLVEEVTRIAQAAAFRHLVTPGGYTMSVAMTNCGRASWVRRRMAERGRFELPEPVKVQRFSRPPHSTTLPPLRDETPL